VRRQYSESAIIVLMISELPTAFEQYVYPPL
jgi:hypothetical protein